LKSTNLSPQSPGSPTKVVSLPTKGETAVSSDLKANGSKVQIEKDVKNTLGIIQSELGTFSKKTEQETVKTFGGDFKGPTFGSSSELLKGSWTFQGQEDSKNSFADMLKSPVKKKVKAQDSSDDNDDEQIEHEEFNTNVDIAPWDPKSLKTGEEEEVNLFTTRCKLFTWEAATDNWKERGLGNLKVNTDSSSNSRLGNFSRMIVVMRAEGVLKVILNVRILKNMPLMHRKDSRFVEFIACETVPDFTKFLVKTGSVEAAQDLYKAIKDIV
jgi:hypothetical protein